MSDMQQSAVLEPVEGQAPELPNPVETPGAEAKVEAPKKEAAPAKPKTSTQPKTQTATKTTDPSKTQSKRETPENKKVPAFESYGVDLSEGYDFNNTPKTDATWDESKFSNGNTSFSSENVITNTVNESSDYSGNQGITNKTQDNSIRSNNNQNNNDNKTTLTDSDLNKIRNAVLVKGTGSSGIETSLSSNTNSTSSNSITMRDGSTRKIIKSSPINLSEEASKTIDFNEMTVKITFKVLTNGNVLPSSIKIDKAIFLDDLVINEINDQIKLWLLAPADSEAEAVFDLTIKRK
ncbi:MAG: hypothetical protein IKX70_07765 [Treponema sp.]|nr:hypothetical protein [Treponema sp.]